MAEGLSLDDILEEERFGRLNSQVGQDGLAEDYDTPAAPADAFYDTTGGIPDDHPSRDSDVDPHEIYDE